MIVDIKYTNYTLIHAVVERLFFNVDQRKDIYVYTRRTGHGVRNKQTRRLRGARYIGNDEINIRNEKDQK